MLLMYARDGEPEKSNIAFDIDSHSAILTRREGEEIELGEIPSEVFDSIAEADKLLICELSIEEKDEEFNKALSAALRSDPDVMMVGEIRSLSAAGLVFKGALSGHSVWTTLHANSAPASVTRLRDMGVQPYMLSDPEIMKGLII